MGTRNLTCVIKGGKFKIAQYGQWDGYPSGVGVDVLSLLSTENIDSLKLKVDDFSFLTDEDIKGKTYEDLPQCHRDVGCKIINLAIEGLVKFQDNSDFGDDSLFCEWAYVINLDSNSFDVYEGFNKTTVTDGLWLSENSTEKESEYEPVKKVASFSFDSLPTEAEFLLKLEPKDED